MKNKIFTIYDQKAKAYLQPFYSNNNATAVRIISDLTNDPDHTFSKHPEDYTLQEIGSFDEETAEIIALDKPLTIATLIQLKGDYDG